MLQLGEYLAYLCLVVSSGYLSAAVVSEEIKTLNGLDWLFDSQRGVWCGLQEKPLIVDVVDLDLPLSELCAAAPMPLIFVRSVVQYEGKSLDYVSNKKQSTGETLGCLLYIVSTTTPGANYCSPARFGTACCAPLCMPAFVLLLYVHSSIHCRLPSGLALYVDLHIEHCLTSPQLEPSYSMLLLLIPQV